MTFHAGYSALSVENLKVKTLVMTKGLVVQEMRKETVTEDYILCDMARVTCA